MMIKISTFILISLFLTTSSFADELTDKPYFVADWGIVNYSDVPTGYSSQAVMTRIAGGYLFIPSLAAEFGYSRFGDFINSPGTDSRTMTASSVQLTIVGNLSLSSRLTIFGKIGLANNNQKIDALAGSISASANSTIIGGGLQYHLKSQLSFRAQYDNFGSFGKLGANNSDMTASAFSLGVVATF